MPNTTPAHCSWFENTDITLQTNDGKEVKVIKFNYQQDEVLLKVWAKHFRKNYCSDEDLDVARRSMGLSRAEYLRDIKFPSTTGWGPCTRSGDFSEILVADYVQFLMNYNVPMTRYDRRTNRDISTAGVDVVGFKLISEERISNNDELITFEVKASLSGQVNNTLQDAIEDSKKDFELRLPITLNAIFQRLTDRGDTGTAQSIERFMNKKDRPYKGITGAALMCTDAVWSEECITGSNGDHPNINTMFLVFKGDNLMSLANQLYEIAYATA